MSPAAQLRKRRLQEITRVYAVMTCLLIVVVVQFVLLLVSVECLQRGRLDVVIPATLASGLGFVASGWLICYILPRPAPRTRR